MQALTHFTWTKSPSADIVSQTLKVVDGAGAVVTHQVLTPDAVSLDVSLALNTDYVATLVASNQFIDSDPATVSFKTPNVVKPDAPSALAETVTLQ